MPIQYQCPECHQFLSIGTRMAGRLITCPACGKEHTVPSPEVAAPPPERPEASSVAEGAHEVETSRLEPVTAPQSPPEPVRPLPSGEIRTEEDDDDEVLFRAYERESDEMDLTPMVDCVFLLLIFFMITASFSIQKTIEVPPPDPEKQGAAVSIKTVDDLEQTSVIVRIDEHNMIYVDDEPLADPDALTEVLRDKMYSEQKNELVLEAHARAFHETVVRVVDAANEVQFQKVRLATTPGSEPD